MTGIVDNILVTGATEKEYVIAMTQILERAKDSIGFDAEKLQYKKKNEVNFSGHIITEQGISPTEDTFQAIRDIQPPKI